MKVFFRQLRDRCTQLVEKQGFPIIVTVCVCIITATALWTRKPDAQPTVPALPTRDVSAAQLQQQSLREAATPSPVPPTPSQPFSPPLAEYTLLTAFSGVAMQRSGVTGIWAVHDAADLQASYGSPVFAIADGTITAAGQDQLHGTWVQINHGDGIEARYAGMENTSVFFVGEAVHGGDTIGHVGNGMLTESDLPPHLHLRITRHGAALDPMTLWD